MNADLDGEDSRWLIVEDGFSMALANTYETLFTVPRRQTAGTLVPDCRAMLHYLIDSSRNT